MVAYNLPSQPTPFVGRNNEVSEIQDLLADSTCRLLTLVGPGGIGKSRLGLEVAGRMHDLTPVVSVNQNAIGTANYPDGVFFVPLQALSAPEFIVSTIAESIGMQFYSGTDRETQLLTYLQNKSLLLILDNFEHLLDGAGLISRLLEVARGLNVIVTSRERLNLQEEWVYEVRGLRYPANGEEDGEAYSAIQLFVQSVRRVNPTFSLESERAAIARICRMVEGMPLAIELASSWGRALPFGELAAEISRGLDILETQARNIPDRHRSMRAVLDFSWQSLTEDEREGIAWLSVFRGGFSRESAERVACPHPRLLAALVDKSWLRLEPSTGRYSIHELVRQYAEERLNELYQAHEARASHCTYYADFMRQREQDIKYKRQIDGLADIERDFENVRVAWTWAASQREHNAMRQMMEALNFYCDMRARFADGEELFRTAAEHFAASQSSDDRLTYAALVGRRYRQIVLGSLTQFGGFAEFSPTLEATTVIVRECNDLPELGFQLHMLGMVQIETAKAIHYFEESSNIFNREEDSFYIAEMMSWLGVCHHDPKQSKIFHSQAADIQREIGDLNGLSWSLQHLARIAFWEHKHAEAERYNQESLAIQRQRGDLKGLHYSMIMGCQRKFRSGEFEEARAMAQEAYRIALMVNLDVLKQAALSALGIIAILHDEDYETGERYLAEVLRMNMPGHYAVGDSLYDAYSGSVIAAYHRGDMDKAGRIYAQMVATLKDSYIAWISGKFALLAIPAIFILAGEKHYEWAVEVLSRALQLPEEPDYPSMGWLAKTRPLQRLMNDLRAELGDAGYNAAWERGKTLDITETTQMLLGDLRQPVLSTAAKSDTLTGREVEILQLAAEGLSNSQIAERVILSRGTVKWYMSEIYSKLGVVNRAQAIARAHDLHLLS
jgi:predicted ATPase/DNA-binding CsgD family transcriptional regulator